MLIRTTLIIGSIVAVTPTTSAFNWELSESTDATDNNDPKLLHSDVAWTVEEHDSNEVEETVDIDDILLPFFAQEDVETAEAETRGDDINFIPMPTAGIHYMNDSDNSKSSKKSRGSKATTSGGGSKSAKRFSSAGSKSMKSSKVMPTTLSPSISFSPSTSGRPSAIPSLSPSASTMPSSTPSALPSSMPSSSCPVGSESPPIEGTLITVPSVTSGTTVGEPITPFGFCGTSQTTSSKFFRVIGTGNTITASTCNDGCNGTGSANYDSKISVFKSCGFVCEAGRDDFAGCSGFSSQVSFNSMLGEEYTIIVHGFGSAVGDFNLAVHDSSPSC